VRRYLKIALPYVGAVLGAIAIFAAGAYSGAWFTGRVLTAPLGQRDLAQLADRHALLHSLDAGHVEDARTLLILEEDGDLMSLDMLSPYLSDDLAKSTCRIMQVVAKRRADNAAMYAKTEASSDPEVRNFVAAALQHPAACGRASR
jgi:hypothetical protein